MPKNKEPIKKLNQVSNFAKKGLQQPFYEHLWIDLYPNKKNITAQKMMFSIKDFFSKCDQTRRFLRIWSHLLKKFLMENFIFVQCNKQRDPVILRSFEHNSHKIYVPTLRLSELKKGAYTPQKNFQPRSCILFSFW